jgi:DNA polymerase/3'-5' exonuclease PolX
MNQGLIDNLNELAKYYSQTGDKWRDQAYQKAIFAIKTFPTKITKISQVKNLPGIGAKIQEKINQYLTTGDIRQVGEVKAKKEAMKTADTKSSALHKLEGVWGVGPVKANELYDAGIRHVDELHKRPDLLNRQQSIGLKHYVDLGRRIARADILIFNVILVYTLNKAFGPDTFQLELAGSYRRGEVDSGDIDCLIHSTVFDLAEVVRVLADAHIITDILALKDSKFEGIARYESSGDRYFRLDIEFVHRVDEWGAELLYFTGNKGINIMLRGEAKKRGWILNQHGLFKKDGTRLPVYTEKEFFSVLGVKYIHPSFRVY